jgi:NAD(P)-dependent dehydrogenase (short-subunit alcohol dehydrogenase family)
MSITIVQSPPGRAGARPRRPRPLGRPGQPAEIAPLYVLLASADAGYVTGEVFGSTGGNAPY